MTQLVKESDCNARDLSSIPGSGRSAGEGIGYQLQYSWASLVAQLVKNLPAKQETWVESLDREDPLEEGLDLRSRECQAEGLESAKALGQECQWYLRMRKEEELG